MTDPGGTSTTGAGPRRARAAWEVPEILAAVVLAAVTVLAVGNLAAGLVGAATLHSTRYEGTLMLGDVLAEASSWAVLALLLLAATLGLLWRQVATWADVEPALPPDEADDTGHTTDDDGYRTAAGHLDRARRLAAWAGLALLATAAAAVANWVAVLLERLGFPVQPYTWERIVASATTGVVVLVAVAAGLSLVARMVRRCGGWPDQDLDSSEPDDSEPEGWDPAAGGPATGAAEAPPAGAVAGSATPS